MRELLNQPHGDVPNVKKFTQRQIALYLCGGDEERAANFQRRVWAPSKPVFHLVIAQDLLMCVTMGNEQNELDLSLESALAVKAILDESSRVAPLICADPRFGVDDERLLHLEWVD
jgi:hypothetical protein